MNLLYEDRRGQVVNYLTHEGLPADTAKQVALTFHLAHTKMSHILAKMWWESLKNTLQGRTYSLLQTEPKALEHMLVTNAKDFADNDPVALFIKRNPGRAAALQNMSYDQADNVAELAFKKELFANSPVLSLQGHSGTWIWVLAGRGTCPLWLSREMKNCGEDPSADIYALLDQNNSPHAMMSLRRGLADEFLGRANSTPKPKYWPAAKALIKHLGARVDPAISNDFRLVRFLAGLPEM